MTDTYDSTDETLKHIGKVNDLMCSIAARVMEIAAIHDASKLRSPEKEAYDEFTPKLSSVPYGSDEYKAYLKEMGVALQHHYQENRHHPEHFENGIMDMTLLDLIEMLCDWKAATERVKDGSLKKSLDYNRTRFQMDNSIYWILKNTAKYFGWIE